MKKEELMALGLDEATAIKVEKASTEELKGFIPKARFDEVNETKKTLETQLTERDTQLTELNKKVKGNEELEKTIVDLQTANATTKMEYETKLKDITINSAIQAKLTDTKYPDLLITKFDKSKIVVGADGSVSGVDEQLTSIKETYKDLFTVDVKGKEPNNKGGSQPPTGKKQELETIINDPKTSFVQRVAAKNQLFKIESEE